MELIRRRSSVMRQGVIPLSRHSTTEGEEARRPGVEEGEGARRPGVQEASDFVPGNHSSRFSAHRFIEIYA